MHTYLMHRKALIEYLVNIPVFVIKVRYWLQTFAECNKIIATRAAVLLSSSHSNSALKITIAFLFLWIQIKSSSFRKSKYKITTGLDFNSSFKSYTAIYWQVEFFSKNQFSEKKRKKKQYKLSILIEICNENALLSLLEAHVTGNQTPSPAGVMLNRQTPQSRREVSCASVR